MVAQKPDFTTAPLGGPGPAGREVPGHFSGVLRMAVPHWRFDEPHDLLAEFAAGATGKVRVVRDPSAGTDFAVKSLRPELTAAPGSVAALAESLDAVRRLDHPGAVVVDQVVEHDNQVVLVMRPVPGGDLGSLLAGRGRLESVEAVVIMAQLCDVLAAAHDAGIVHGDVKPANVLLERTEQSDGPVVVRLSDFGMAALAERAKPADAAGNPVQPAEYRAPELGAGGAATTACDVYAVGAVLYQTLAGQPPFTGPDPETVAALHRESRPERMSDVPDSLWLLITGCLDKRPQFRPTAPALARVLRELVPELEEVDLAANPAPDPVPEAASERASERETVPPTRQVSATALPVVRPPAAAELAKRTPNVKPAPDPTPAAKPASDPTPVAKPAPGLTPIATPAPGLTPVRAGAVAVRMAQLTSPPRSVGGAVDSTLQLPAVVATADPPPAPGGRVPGRPGPGQADPGPSDPGLSDPRSPRKKSRRVLAAVVVGAFAAGALVVGYLALDSPGRHGTVADLGAAPTELSVGHTGGNPSPLIASLTPRPSSTGSVGASPTATGSASASASIVAIGAGRTAVQSIPSTAPTTAKATTAKATAVASPTTGIVTGADGLCLDDANDRTVVDNQIDLYTCNGSEAQAWTVVPADNSLQVRNMCMEVRGGATASGSTIVIDTCDASAAQVFVPRSNGEVYNPNSGDCLTDPGGSTQLGVIMQIQACTGGAGQVWTMPS